MFAINVIPKDIILCVSQRLDTNMRFIGWNPFEDGWHNRVMYINILKILFLVSSVEKL